MPPFGWFDGSDFKVCGGLVGGKVGAVLEPENDFEHKRCSYIRNS